MTDKNEDFGEATLNATGLDLPIDLTEPANSDEDAAKLARPVTAEDLAALAEVEAELNERWPETKIDPTLDRIRQLMDLLGNPQRNYQAVHVAGTNGKTSVVRMVEALLRAFHRRTGRTTSPHLQLATERIAIDGVPLHPADYVRTWREIEPFVDMVDTQSEAAGGPRMSKFEILVAMAYAAFADAPVDVAVVEVGMGGRWDATNVIDADVAVVTPVGLDHTDYLGDTLAEIAGEKAGIIKQRWDADDLLTPPDNVAVIAEQEPEALEVLLRQAVESDSSVARAGSEFAVVESTVAVGGQTLTLKGLGGVYTDIFLPLSGAHQARNAATALAAVEAFFGAGAGRMLDEETVRRGFAQVSSPGRLERVRATPSVFIDASHNPHGARALAQAIDRDFSFRRLIGVVGVLGDKDARGILAALEPVLDEIVVTQNTSPRAVDVEDLAEYARDAFGEERVHVAPNLPGAVELAVELAEDDGGFGDSQVSGAGVLVTGSVVTAGDARTLFGKDPA
ncbi:Dhydrofolate synthase / folylpolyglutamate synthase [Corynebacterium glyciniphilum AJ 3170]|uniref:Dihydrofolate synthase/folylpolyglutamate synthase n=1 Tax=Corynebacterium glyciniphilum AJ 3170 TaxID=1404245 RepID=X5DTZ7_9CORY|nr:folylpolyglutamate synthase/dihydrofolate synthase family protein [Corynebacterium glyciniphilum]AHW64739.1 Dhydrofolate synthase / folylpolyglutamate synthase [Corynebacterium glyciniphilum AJ 3170]